MSTPSPQARLGDLDEAALLALVLPLLGGSAVGVEVGPGDDAAVVAVPGGSVVATTDSMVRGVDWRDDWSAPGEVGRKLVTQNVADLAAMGARPIGLLLSVLADPQTPLTWLLDFARGVGAQAAEHDIPPVGGDLSSAPAGVLVVSATALGDLEGRAPLLRSGAHPGDVVAVRGTLGHSSAGLAEYAAGELASNPGQGARQRAQASVMAVHRTPSTSWRAGVEAAQAGASSAIDVSDGLVRDLTRVAVASRVRVDLEGASLLAAGGPLADLLPPEQVLAHVLTGGEEHSLVATFPGGTLPSGWQPLGRVLAAGEGPLVTVDGVAPAGDGGWDHFRR